MEQEQPEAKAPKKRRIDRITPDNLPTVYTNNIEIQQSNFDFRLRFGLIQMVSSEAIQVQDLVIVYMSPQHAKSVVDVLAAQVSAYERRFGALKPIPSEGTKQTTQKNPTE